MSCEGVWKVEMKGPYGWETIATAFMKNGKYLGASTNHYSVGSYKQDGDDLEISMNVTQYGDVRPVFGRKHAKKLQVKQGERCEKIRYSDAPYQARITGAGLVAPGEDQGTLLSRIERTVCVAFSSCRTRFHNFPGAFS